MSRAPGVQVTSRADTPPRGAPTDTGVLYAVGLAERGQSNTPLEVTSLTVFERLLGERVSYGLLHDTADIFFKEGGQTAHFARVVGPAAAVATVNLQDGSAVDTLQVDALGEGAWGNDLTVAVSAGEAAGTYVLTIKYDGTTVETSPDLADPAAAVEWADNSDYVRITDLASGSADPNPATVGDTALTGGDDDRANITDTEWQAAIDALATVEGPGQVAAPGQTGSTIHIALADHAEANNRQALCDASDSGTVATLTGEFDSIVAGATDPAYFALLAPWVTYPGPSGSQRTIPPSAAVAGAIATRDASDGPNVPAAGDDGILAALDVTQTFDADERATLNDAGVNIIRNIRGQVQLYGYRTGDIDGDWEQLSNQRLRLLITAQSLQIGERFVFDQIDGQGHKLAEFRGALEGMLTGHWQDGALYGDTASDAFAVDVGPSVNPPEQLADGELAAVESVRMSPFAELVTIEIVKRAITETV